MGNWQGSVFHNCYGKQLRTEDMVRFAGFSDIPSFYQPRTDLMPSFFSGVEDRCPALAGFSAMEADWPFSQAAGMLAALNRLNKGRQDKERDLLGVEMLGVYKDLFFKSMFQDLPFIWWKTKDHPVFQLPFFKTYQAPWATWCKIQVG